MIVVKIRFLIKMFASRKSLFTHQVSSSLSGGDDQGNNGDDNAIILTILW